MLEGGLRVFAYSGVIAGLCDKGWDLSKKVQTIQSEQKTEGTEESNGRLRPASQVSWNAT